MFLTPADRNGGTRGELGLPGQPAQSGRAAWLAAPYAAVSTPGPALPRRVARAGPQPGGRLPVISTNAEAGPLPSIITDAEVSLAQASVRSGGCFTRPLPLDGTCAKVARTLFREAVSGADLPSDLVYDGVTMASELAANTLNAHDNVEFGGHGHRAVSGIPEFWLYLRTAGSGREIVCKIFDSDPGWDAGEPVPVGAAVPAGPDSIRGRGLQMVAGLSAGRWGHHPSRGRLGAWKVPGKAVWFALRVPPTSDLAHSPRITPHGWRAIGEIAAALADRGLGAGLVQIAEPAGSLAVLSVSQRLTVWCRGDLVWWREPDGSNDQTDTNIYTSIYTTDFVEITERIICAHEELSAIPWPDSEEAAIAVDASPGGADQGPGAMGAQDSAPEGTEPPSGQGFGLDLTC